MLVAALVTVIVVFFPSVVGTFGVIVTVVPLMLAVATLSSLDFTLNAPPLVFFVTVNVPLFGYVIVPLVALNVKFPFVFVCFPTVTVFVVSAFAYPAFVALIDIEYVLAPVTCGIVVLYVPPFSEYSIVVPVGFVLTVVNAGCDFPS